GEGFDSGYFLGSYWAGQVWEELLRVSLGGLKASIIAEPRAFSGAKELVCVAGIFLFSKSWKGSSHCLERFWARLSVSHAERAVWRFSVVAAWRPFKRAKPAAWDPPPGLQIRACSGRFSGWISSQNSSSVS